MWVSRISRGAGSGVSGARLEPRSLAEDPRSRISQRNSGTTSGVEVNNDRRANDFVFGSLVCMPSTFH